MGCPFLLQGVLPDPGIEPRSSALQVDSLPSELPGKGLGPSKKGDGHFHLNLWENYETIDVCMGFIMKI